MPFIRKKSSFYNCFFAAILILSTFAFPFFAQEEKVQLVIQTGNKGGVASIAISPDGKILASGNGNTIHIWNLENGRELFRLKGHTQPVIAVAISPNGKTLVSGSDIKSIRAWDLENGKEIWRLYRTGPGYPLVINPDGKSIISTNFFTNTIFALDIENGKEIWRLKENISYDTSIAISPDGKTMAVGSKDKTIHNWNLARGEQLNQLKGHTGGGTCVAISPDSKILVSGSKDKTIRTWDLKTGKKLLWLVGHTDIVTSVAISPDSKILVSGSKDKTIRTWDLETGTELRHWNGNSTGVKAVLFSNNEHYIFSDGEEGEIKIWDTHSGTTYASIISFDNNDWIAYTPDNYYICSPGAEKYIGFRSGNHVFKASKFSDQYNKKDLFAEVLKSTADITEERIGKPGPVKSDGNERGTKIVVKTKEGKKIQLYEGAYALVVGNGNYKNGWDSLPGALKDVNEVAAVLKDIGYNVTLKNDLDKHSFDKAFTEFSVKYGQDSENQLLFYFAGHGHTEKMANDEDMGYIVMVDTPAPEKDFINFKLSSIDMQVIVTQAKMIKSKHVLFIFDSCFSGTILNVRTEAKPEYISDNVKYPVRQFITAGRANEPVPDRSVFKRVFLDLLQGKVKEPIPDGYITGEEMGLYLKQKVPQYNPTQHPQYGKINDPKLNKGDFVFLDLNKYASPPPLPGIDFSNLDIVNKWKKWQDIFQNEVDKLKEREKSSQISASSKKAAWERILNTYRHNNPFTKKDEQLRAHAEERKKYWKNYKSPNLEQRGLRDIKSFLFYGPKVGKQHLVLIAITRYKYWHKLNGPVKDAKEIKDILTSRYKIDAFRELYDENADKAGIVELFKNLQAELKPEDSLLIFYSGHGYLDEATETGYLIPSDGGLDSNLMDRWIPNSQIIGYINQIKSNHIFLIYDSSFAGTLVEITRGMSSIVKIEAGGINNEYFRRAYAKHSRLILTSGEIELVPDISELVPQLTNVLRNNDMPYIDAFTLYNEIRVGMKKTMPIFGPIRGTNHQQGGTFLLFLKEEFYK